MASGASRSMSVSRFDGLLAPAAELFRIVRASYLSPSFPFFLCLELWQYLRSTRHSRRPSRKVTPGSPSTLPLLRAAALAVMLMLPTEGWAQVQVAPEFPPAPAAPVPPQGNAVAQADGTSSGNGPLFPRTTVKTGVTSEDVLKQEERQRIMGVMPNFNTVEMAAVPSLSPRQKFHLMFKADPCHYALRGPFELGVNLLIKAGVRGAAFG
jgi:hypothetical protein